MYKIILIDDEPLARSVVREYLQQHPELQVIQECGDGFEGVKAIQQQFAIRAFKFSAVDYLLKPFNQERFDKAIARWREKELTKADNPAQELLESAALSPTQRQRIVVRNGSKIKIISVHDVFYLEAADDYVKIHTAEGYFLKNKTMAHFEQSLDEHLFVRSHRSYIINIQQIVHFAHPEG